MTTSRDRVLRTLLHEPTDRAPRDVWLAPGIEAMRADELAELRARYAADIVRMEMRAAKGNRVQGAAGEAGEHTDAWGCTWHVPRRHAAGELVSSPLEDARQIAAYQPPWELIEKAGFSAVNRSCAETPQFALAWTDVRPFDRLQFLRGRQAAMADLAHGTKAIRDLLDMLHDFYAREIEAWADTDVDGVAFSDDWGSPDGLLVPVDAWRGLFKPIYREFCETLRGRDKFAFFRCGGNIAGIFDDLVDMGVDAIHCEMCQVGLDRLAAQFRNQVTFWTGMDDFEPLRRGTPADVRAAVRRVRTALDFGRGGVIAQGEWTLDTPFDNLAAMFEQWLAPLPAHAHAR